MAIFFIVLVDKSYDILVKKFNDNGIDLILNLQKDNSFYLEYIKKRTTDSEYDRRYVRKSEHYIRHVVSGDYLIDTVEKKEQFDMVLNRTVKIKAEDTHRDSLAMILIAIDLKYPKDKILSLIKDFVTTNKTINPNAQKNYKLITKTIKDWKLDNHFNLSEQKALFNPNTSGFEIKQGDVLLYTFDVNTLKARNKKSTSLIITSNIKALGQALTPALGDLDCFISCSRMFDDPIMELSIVFEKGTSEKYKEVIDELVTEIATTSKIMEPNYLQKILQANIMAVELTNDLKSDDTKPRTKMKI